MRGNDIIDLKVAAKESNWQRKGFLEKIFTPQERIYITEALCPEKMVWTLWSQKESAYKAYTRQFSGRFFDPKKINCTLLTACAGTATINSTTYRTVSSIADKYIYSIASHEGLTAPPLTDYLFYSNTNDYTTLSGIIYQLMIAKFAAATGKSVNNISVIKNTNGIPFLEYKKNQQAIPVSISHHGQYGAFTIN